MKLKTVVIDGKTYAVTDENGLPVYVHSDGKEVGFDAVGTNSRIGALNREAQNHREALEAAQGRLKGFEGIDDPDAARNALSTVANLKAGDLKNAEQVREIQEAARKAAEDQVREAAKQSTIKMQELEKERDSFRDSLYAEKVGGAFSRSAYIKDKTVNPPDMLQALFGRQFKVEGNDIVPYGLDGNKLYSRSRPGELASFEEGLELMIDQYPHKSSILKGTGHSGTGGQGHAGGGQMQGGKPTMGRAAFERLDPGAKAAAVKSHTLVDDAA